LKAQREIDRKELKEKFDSRVDRSILIDAIAKDQKQFRKLGTQKFNLKLNDFLPFVNEGKTISMIIQRRIEHE